MAPLKDCSRQAEDDRCKYSDDAAERAVKRVFAVLGVDIEDPQQVAEFQQDLRFGRLMRCAANKGFIAVVVLAATAIGVATWAGIVGKVTGK